MKQKTTKQWIAEQSKGPKFWATILIVLQVLTMLVIPDGLQRQLTALWFLASLGLCWFQKHKGSIWIALGNAAVVLLIYTIWYNAENGFQPLLDWLNARFDPRR